MAERGARRADPHVQPGNLGPHQGYRQALLCRRAAILPDVLPGNTPDFPNFTWREYGQRVGIWRLFDLFDQLGAKASCTANAVTFQRRAR